MKYYKIIGPGVKNSQGRELPIGCTYETDADLTANPSAKLLNAVSLKEVVKEIAKAETKGKGKKVEKRDDEAGTNV
jgi:hypothetical protein